MTQRPCVTDTVLRMALACWSVDPEHGMLPSQHAVLTTRIKDLMPLTLEERVRLRKPLLAWAERFGGERLAAVVRRQYEATVVPQEVAS